MKDKKVVNVNDILRIKIDKELLILDRSKELSKEKDRLSKSLDFYINVITSASRGKLKETAHSKILHDLLHHKEILASFLFNVAGLPKNTFTPDDINYPDTNRIDLSLESIANRKFLIIENKANNAPEQRGQLYRYVNIARNKKFEESEIDILYLNSETDTPPSLYSRSENGKGSDKDKHTVPVSKIKIKTYKYDILAWLIELEKSFKDSTEIYLKSALIQYIDYLKEYFEINERYNEINKFMKEEILKHLGIGESVTLEHKIQVLEDYSKDIEDLKNKVDRIIQELNVQRTDQIFEEGIRKLSATYPNVKFERINNELLKKEVIFYFQLNDFQLYGSFKFYNNIPYWAICSGSDQIPSDIILTQLREILEEMPVDTNRKYGEGKKDDGPKWLFYNNPSIENWEDRIFKFFTILKNYNGIIIEEINK